MSSSVLALSSADSSVTSRQFYSYAICHMAASFSETAPQALPDWSHYIPTVIQQNSCHCWAWLKLAGPSVPWEMGQLARGAMPVLVFTYMQPSSLWSATSIFNLMTNSVYLLIAWGQQVLAHCWLIQRYLQGGSSDAAFGYCCNLLSLSLLLSFIVMSV